MDIDDLHELRAAKMRNSLFRGLLSSEGLASLANRNGLGHFSEDAIHSLWSIGLLRADYVSCESPPERADLLPVQANEYGATYLDARILEARDHGYGSAAADIAPLNEGWSVLFHPFRLFVLYHVQRVFENAVSSTQFLTWQPGIQSIASWHEESLVRFTSGKEFGARFNDWNIICEVALIAEPMLKTRFVPGGQPQGELYPMAMLLLPWLRKLGEPGVREMREELGRAADDMDPNSLVHVLLRLAQQQHRANLKGRLGACLHFLNMAESIRRAAEIALDRHLPEEDEIGWRTWMRGARRMLYGTERVFDAGFGDVRNFLTLLGLDHGVRVRCYVEGETELGAMMRAVGSLGAIEFVNLRGQFVQRGGKGLAFAESLEADYAAKVISVVLLDGDVGENLRVLKKAVRDGRCFAPFFVSNPDFEQMNFTQAELNEVLDVFNRGSQGSGHARPAAAEDLTSEARKEQTPLSGACMRAQKRLLPKSESWGEALMNYALAHPDLPSLPSGESLRRPMLDAAELLMRACRAGFQSSVDSFSVDVATGRLVEKLQAR